MQYWTGICACFPACGVLSEDFLFVFQHAVSSLKIFCLFSSMRCPLWRFSVCFPACGVLSEDFLFVFQHAVSSLKIFCLFSSMRCPLWRFSGCWNSSPSSRSSSYLTPWVTAAGNNAPTPKMRGCASLGKSQLCIGQYCIVSLSTAQGNKIKKSVIFAVKSFLIDTNSFCNQFSSSADFCYTLNPFTLREAKKGLTIFGNMLLTKAFSSF